MNKRLLFDCACNGLVRSMRDAADPAYPEWQPYMGDTGNIAVWLARRVVRMARDLGLYRPDRQCTDCRAVWACIPGCACRFCLAWDLHHREMALMGFAIPTHERERELVGVADGVP